MRGKCVHLLQMGSCKRAQVRPNSSLDGRNLKSQPKSMQRLPKYVLGSIRNGILRGI